MTQQFVSVLICQKQEILLSPHSIGLTPSESSPTKLHRKCRKACPKDQQCCSHDCKRSGETMRTRQKFSRLWCPLCLFVQSMTLLPTNTSLPVRKLFASRLGIWLTSTVLVWSSLQCGKKFLLSCIKRCLCHMSWRAPPLGNQKRIRINR